ncbi:Uncharacterized protein FWK35_00031899, partial [Aphis craccivora]
IQSKDLISNVIDKNQECPISDVDSGTSETVNSTNIDDPIRTFPKNSLEFREKNKRGAYRPILSVYPCTQMVEIAFCFPCRVLNENELNSSRTDQKFSTNGFKRWYRANKSFLNHKTTKSHINSTSALNAF